MGWMRSTRPVPEFVLASGGTERDADSSTFHHTPETEVGLSG